MFFSDQVESNGRDKFAPPLNSTNMVAFLYSLESQQVSFGPTILSL